MICEDYSLLTAAALQATSSTRNRPLSPPENAHEPTYLISSLVPYKANCKLTMIQRERVIKLILFYTVKIIDAINAFLTKDYKAFDPHVSDNLCQIRASMFQSVFQSRTISTLKDRLNRRLDFFSKQLKKLDDIVIRDVYLKRVTKQDKNAVEDFKDFLSRMGLSFFLTEFEVFLLSSYLLTEFRSFSNEKIPVAIDYQRLSEHTFIGSLSFVSKISHLLQRILSELSCNYIDAVTNDESMRQLMPGLKQQDEVKRTLYPCYWVTKIILSNALASGHQIILVIDDPNHCRKLVCFRANSNKSNFELCSTVSLSNSDSTCLVFQGVSDLAWEGTGQLSQLIKIGCEDIILQNMAVHPQYAGKKLRDLRNDPITPLNPSLAQLSRHRSIHPVLMEQKRQFHHHKQNGLVNGCMPGAQSLFLIKHIYCDSLMSLLQ